MTGMLASVTSVSEAERVLQANVDIIDIKDPSTGALGAQQTSTVINIVNHVAGRKTVSATIGDINQDDSDIPQLIEKMAATGVDIVKVGLFDVQASATFLEYLAAAKEQDVRIVVVLFAEHYQFELSLPDLLDSGVHGIMIDTCIKNGRSLSDLMQEQTLNQFVEAVQARGMIAGLAGSLRYEHIPALRAIRADYLGFRGALCKAGNRNNVLDGQLVSKIKQAVQEDENNSYPDIKIKQAI